jgi:hypothetical protein
MMGLARARRVPIRNDFVKAIVVAADRGAEQRGNRNVNGGSCWNEFHLGASDYGGAHTRCCPFYGCAPVAAGDSLTVPDNIAEMNAEQPLIRLTPTECPT